MELASLLFEGMNPANQKGYVVTVEDDGATLHDGSSVRHELNTIK